jgi:hypothetical protein
MRLGWSGNSVLRVGKSFPVNNPVIVFPDAQNDFRQVLGYPEPFAVTSREVEFIMKAKLDFPAARKRYKQKEFMRTPDLKLR